MKIVFWHDNNANIHSRAEETYTPEKLGLTEEEWKALTEDEKYEMVKEWALQNFDYGYREKE